MKIKINVNQDSQLISPNSQTIAPKPEVAAHHDANDYAHHDVTDIGVDADIEISKHKKGPHLKETI